MIAGALAAFSYYDNVHITRGRKLWAGESLASWRLYRAATPALNCSLLNFYVRNKFICLSHCCFGFCFGFFLSYAAEVVLTNAENQLKPSFSHPFSPTILPTLNLSTGELWSQDFNRKLNLFARVKWFSFKFGAKKHFKRPVFRKKKISPLKNPLRVSSYHGFQAFHTLFLVNLLYQCLELFF